MKRKVIRIDEEKCNGCGLCADACHEGAINMVNGKAKLVSESYCDGLGACLPHGPAEAITIEEREAQAFDEAYARRHQLDRAAQAETKAKPAFVCPGTAARALPPDSRQESQLAQWPCQIKLAPIQAPYFHNASLLIAADCTAYACANIHGDFMRGRVTLIGCSKLDDTDYSEKLKAVLSANDIKSITVLRMEVPCCGGIVSAVKNAIVGSGKMLPWRVVTIGVDGRILED